MSDDLRVGDAVAQAVGHQNARNTEMKVGLSTLNPLRKSLPSNFTLRTTTFAAETESPSQYYGSTTQP